MNQKEAIEKAKQMNEDGFEFLLGGKIRFVAQYEDGSWFGFPETPEKLKMCGEWSGKQNVCIDKQWNDDWENTLAVVK